MPKGISKKIRFEVFKRDGFRCIYCGKTPPQITLEIDHINPKSKNGSDDINNLVAACFDCNRGKKNIPLDIIPAQLKDNLKILKEKEIQLKEYNKHIQKIEKRINSEIEEISVVFQKHFTNKENNTHWFFTDNFKYTTIKTLLKFLHKQEIIDSLWIAINKFPTEPERVLKYFCGICWNKIKGGRRAE